MTSNGHLWDKLTNNIMLPECFYWKTVKECDLLHEIMETFALMFEFYYIVHCLLNNLTV